jgi:hypothetical protein
MVPELEFHPIAMMLVLPAVWAEAYARLTVA